MSTFTIFLILIIIVCLLLMLVIMVQNPKGGGLSSSFGGGGSQVVGGVKKTGDFLDKSTWTLAILLIALILSNCQKTEIDCSKKESYLEQCKILGKVKSIKSQVFELTKTENGNYKKRKPKLVSFGHRYYKEINQNGYLTNWINYENNSEEIKSKSLLEHSITNFLINKSVF